MDQAAIRNEFVQAAKTAAQAYADKHFGGHDGGACGFAWVDIYGIKGNTKLGKAMKAAGIERSDYKKCFSIWNPSEHGAQNIDTKEAGALAAQKVFEKYGFRAYAGSRLD
mgnify:CR=1 FL=1